MRGDIEHVRKQKLAKFCQVMLISKEGLVVESCNSIFDVSKYSNKNIVDWFPFLESTFPTVRSQPKDTPALIFSKVENPSSFLPGYYDFTFSIVEIDEKEFVLWEIYDFTTLYEDFRHYQQKRNELEIQRQLLALQNKQLKNRGDILNRENLILNLREKIESPLTTYDTALDAIMTFITDDKSNDLLASLSKMSKQLIGIVKELPENRKKVSGGGIDENIFSLENVFYDSVQFIASQNKEINIIEASVAEDLPVRLFGDALGLKRIVVGLATNISKLYSNVVLKMHLYLENKTDARCLVGIQVKAIEGKELNIPISESLLRIAIIKKIIKMNQGTLEMETSSVFGSEIKCNIPFMLV